MLAFHNNPKIKTKYLKRIRAHAKADEIIKGKYWEGGKGCAVGCTIHSNAHNKYKVELGIPTILAQLEDRIFENLPNDLAKTFPERFLKSIPVGKDLSEVWPKFAIFLLTDSSQCASRHPQCNIVASHYNDELNGIKVNWVDVKSAAYASNASAAHAAAHAAAVAYADASVIYVAHAAAYAAHAYADAKASVTAAFIKQSEKLLELLAE